MKAIYERAQAALNKTQKEEILAKSGLHDVYVCVQSFA
jgi:hypothetical protein